MQEPIDLSIIIVNYNTGDFLRRCLQSVFEHMRGVTFDVWVVDNASGDGSVEMVVSAFPKVRIIANKENIGFAGANNQAIKESVGKHLLLLNPDTVILDEGVKMLVDFMEQRSRVGAVGPLVLNQDGTMQRQCKRGWPTLWNSLAYYSGLWKLFPKNDWWRKKFGGYFLLDKSDDEICEVSCLSGAAMMVRRAALEDVGLLCEDYVMYSEDIDLCFRIKRAGWQVFYFPLAKITHYGGASSGRSPALRNLWYFHRGACMLYHRFLAQECFFLTNLLFYTSVWFFFVVKILLNFSSRERVIGSKKPRSL